VVHIDTHRVGMSQRLCRRRQRTSETINDGHQGRCTERRRRHKERAGVQHEVTGTSVETSTGRRSLSDTEVARRVEASTRPLEETIDKHMRLPQEQCIDRYYQSAQLHCATLQEPCELRRTNSDIVLLDIGQCN